MTTRKLTLVICIVFPILSGLLVFAVRTVEFQRTWNTVSQAAPVYHAPAELVTEPVEYGQVAIAKFHFTNRGGGDLVLDNIRTSCSCSGLEQVVGDTYSPVNSLSLQSNETVEVAVRVTVREVTNQIQRVAVWMSTTDPTQPEARIIVTVPRVVAGVSVTPENFTFGNVVPDTVVNEEFEIYETAEIERQVTTVTSSDSRVTAELLPQTENQPATGLGRRIGRVRVNVRTDIPAELNATLTMTANLPGRPFPTIAISGRVLSPVELLPSALVFPIKSSEGPIYEAICFCRSTSNTPVRIIIESYSPGLRVELLPANDESNSQRIRVAVKANANGGRDTLFVRLIATVGTVKTSLEIPITIEGYSPK